MSTASSIATSSPRTSSSLPRVPPFDNVLVRKALRAVTDREAILHGAQFGLGGIAYDHPVVESDPVFNPSCRPPEYDPDLAKRLLAEAGYPDGIDLTLYTSTAGANMVEMAKVFAARAAPAGINIDVVVVPEDRYWADVWLKEPFTTVWWGGRTPYEAFSIVYRTAAKWNESHWSSPELDAWLDRARANSNPDDQKRIFGEIQCLLVDEVPRIIPVFSPVLLGLRNDVRGVEPMWDATLSLHRAWLETGTVEQPVPAVRVPQYGGVVRLARSRDPFIQNTDPYQRPFKTLVNSLIFSKLFRVDPFTSTIEGDLVEAWELSDGGLTWTLHLRSDARFHDGSRVTATDVVHSVKAMVDSEITLFQGLRETLVGLEIIDDFTVRIALQEPFASLLSVLANRYAPIVSAPDFLIREPTQEIAEQLIGSGPFLVAEYIPEQSMFLKRNTDYFRQGLPYADGIEILFIQDRDTRLAAFRTGRLDFFGFSNGDFLSLEEQGLAANEKFALFDAYASMHALWFDTQNPPFGDVRVRQAVAHALNRQEVTKVAHGEQGIPQFPVPSLFFPDWAHPQEVVNEVLPYDPERAKQLMAEAGYPDGFETTLYVRGSEAPAAEAIAKYLAQVGIKVDSLVKTRFEEVPAI